MAPKDLDKLIEKYLAGNCTKEERDFIDAWYSSLGSPDFSAQADTRNLRVLEHRMLANIQQSIASPPDVKYRTPLWYYTGIAASIVLCVAAIYYFFTPFAEKPVSAAIQTRTPEFTKIENNSSTSKRVILPDGSLVVLSPQSTVRYPNEPDTGIRELFLEGEAYFDVARDTERPFVVYAGEVITRVLGTSFIVRNQGSTRKVTVSVKTGKVTVYSRKTSHKKMVLMPNQEAIYDKATDLLATQSVPEERLSEERRNFTEMHFDETPVSDVLARLMKSYDIDIIFQEGMLDGCVLTSSFYEEGLYDRIDVICTAIGATYRIVDAQIVIESNGCNLKRN